MLLALIFWPVTALIRRHYGQKLNLSTRERRLRIAHLRRREAELGLLLEPMDRETDLIQRVRHLGDAVVQELQFSDVHLSVHLPSPFLAAPQSAGPQARDDLRRALRVVPRFSRGAVIPGPSGSVIKRAAGAALPGETGHEAIRRRAVEPLR